jgi:hypothetical protein
MQIKVHSAAFKKGMSKKSKRVFKTMLNGMHKIAIEETGKMHVAGALPNQTGRLKQSYSSSLSYPNKTVTFGSNPTGQYNDVVYAKWIETGKRGGVKRIGNRKYFNKARGKVVTSHPRTVGLGRFKKTKKQVLKRIKKIKL